MFQIAYSIVECLLNYLYNQGYRYKINSDNPQSPLKKCQIFLEISLGKKYLLTKVWDIWQTVLGWSVHMKP